jgi:glucose/arabinose dehydrogenase
MDFDPVTGKLWDTENGRYNGDEINLVEPGFNSGWPTIEGKSQLQQNFDINSLVNFNGKGKYSDPEFNWFAANVNVAVAPTALKFIKSDEYGKEYENEMLMADFNHGHIYHFDLNKDRTELSLSNRLEEEVSEDGDDKSLHVILAKFPGGITDLQLGPDGYIYVVSLSAAQSDCDDDMDGCLINGGMRGAIFRIVPEK